MTAAAHLATAPSLMLVRPRRGLLEDPPGGQTDDQSGRQADGRSGRQTEGRPNGSTTTDSGASVLPLNAHRPAEDDHAAPAEPRPSTHPDRTPRVPAGPHPLTADDRMLIESMAPALATALVEVLVGARAPVSIEKWVEAPLFERILEHTRVRRSLSQSNPHTDRPLTTSTARICEVSDSVVEIALVVTTTRRPRALALRLTRRRSRWKLTEFLSI